MPLGNVILDLEQLRAFVEVAQQRSFSRAAAQLHLTQPAISKRIAALERHLDTALFDRIGRAVVLTQTGAHLLASALEVLQRLKDAETAVRNTNGQVDGTLVIATSHHIGLHRLPEVLRSFSVAYPSVQLNIRFEDSEVAHDLVRNGACELAVVTLDPSRATQLASVPLWQDRLRFVACREHVLNAAPIRLADLCLHAAILPGSATYTGRIISMLFTDAGLKLRVTMSTNHLETIRMLVSIGLGWSALPETMLDESLDVLKLIDAPQLQRDLGCVLHPERTLSNAAQAFLAAIQTYAEPMLSPGSGLSPASG